MKNKYNYKELKREIIGMRIAIIIISFICVLLVFGLVYDTKWQKETDNNIKGIVNNQEAFLEVFNYNKEIREDITEAIIEIRGDLKHEKLKNNLHLAYNGLSNKNIFIKSKGDFIDLIESLDKMREQEKKWGNP